jgi:flagellum-specific peptidoglycan hydrolase FlgJ
MKSLKRQTFLLLILFLFGTASHSVAQKSVDIQAYIDTYKELAIQEMQRTGVPAAIKLAQGIHETMAGTSDLVRRSNNHFGIKCKTGWSGDKVYHDDDEAGECFRSYTNAIDSYRDHSDFLKRSQRYQFLFELPATDYEGWAYGLKKAGYATNIKYSQILIKLIQTYQLQQYTLLAQASPVAANDQIQNSLETPKPMDSKSPDAKQVDVKSEEVKSIAETKAFTTSHQVQAKETLYGLAKKYAVEVQQIIEWNQLKSPDLKIGQVIMIQKPAPNAANSGSR